MKRRDFLKSSALVAGSALFPNFTITDKKLKNIGIQLFSLPRLLEKDVRAGIELLAQMGYEEVELYGPFPFSAESARERWAAVTPMLGFSGSGYFGLSASEFKAILDDAGIRATSTHTDLDTLQTRMPQLGEAADLLGLKYVGLPSIPEEKRSSLDDYRRIAGEFNNIGEQARQVGLKFAYHNHGYGLQEVDGEVPLNIVLDETDPDLVFFEMDIYWTTAGGADPLQYLRTYPKRYKLMHLKDMQEKVRFSGDGGSPSEWVELFPYMTNAGDGVLDIKSIVETGKKAGVEHFYVEQDMVANPEVALKKSIEYLKSI